MLVQVGIGRGEDDYNQFFVFHFKEQMKKQGNFLCLLKAVKSNGNSSQGHSSLVAGRLYYKRSFGRE